MTERTPLAELDQSSKQQTTTKSYVSNPKDVSINDSSWDGVPAEMYKYFNTNPLDGGAELKLVAEWAGENAKSQSDIIRKVRNLEIKLGQPNAGETRIIKLSNWIRMDKAMRDAQVSFKAELGSIKTHHNKRINELKATYKDRVGKLNVEIAKIEASYRDAYKTTKRRTMSEMSTIKGEYGKQLKELKGLRSVYQKEK